MLEGSGYCAIRRRPMLFKRRTKQETRTSQRLPVGALPNMTQRWRRLARIRDRLIVNWLGGIFCMVLCLLLVKIFPSIEPQLTTFTGVLIIYWFGSGFVLAYWTS